MALIGFQNLAQSRRSVAWVDMDDLLELISLSLPSRPRYCLCLLSCSLFIAATPLNALAKETPVPPNSVSPEVSMRRGEIQKVEASLAKIADRGAALFFLARRYAQLGDLDKALSLLK